MNPLIKTIESTLIHRDPILINKLKAGLTEQQIKTKLKRARVVGEINAVVDLYTWRNGTLLDLDLGSSKVGFFPGEAYQFIDLEMAVAHMKGFKEVVRYNEKLSDITGDLFPAFWDGSTGWLAIDTKLLSSNRIVMIEFESIQPTREVYATFEDFLKDCIRANEEGEGLECFS